jgi:hypothetical protein
MIFPWSALLHPLVGAYAKAEGEVAFTTRLRNGVTKIMHDAVVTSVWITKQGSVESRLLIRVSIFSSVLVYSKSVKREVCGSSMFCQRKD